MTFAQHLKDPRWQRKRLEVFQRDNFRCVICAKEDREIHCHHIIYERDRKLWDYPLAMFQTLCSTCHKDRHEIMDNAINALRLSLAKVPTRRLMKVTERICTEAMEEMAV